MSAFHGYAIIGLLCLIYASMPARGCLQSILKSMAVIVFICCVLLARSNAPQFTAEDFGLPKTWKLPTIRIHR